MYAAYFAEGRAINETDVVLQIATETGLNAQEIGQALANDAIKAKLKTEVDQALERGVFGSPFVLIGNEPFWGFDRFDHIERWLRENQ
jgi:2-hydroxychromene-2-carboxylate isomerase